MSSSLLVVFAAVSLACDSGAPPIQVAPTSTGTVGVSGAIPLPPPHKDQRRFRELKTVTLLEVSGRAPEADAFVGRLQSELSDKDIFRLADARLSGATLSPLASDPQGPEARAFREAWPGEAYLVVNLGQCSIKGTRTSLSDHTPEGYRTESAVMTYSAECSASTQLVDAEDGHVLATVNVKGSFTYNGDNAETGGTPAEEGAAREAATRTVKKLRSVLSR